MVEWLPSMLQALGSSPTECWVHTCNLSPEELEAEGSEVQGHAWLPETSVSKKENKKEYNTLTKLSVYCVDEINNLHVAWPLKRPHKISK